MAGRPRVLIITGNGVNCEQESREAWVRAGADVEMMHMHDLLAEPGRLQRFRVLMLIGGFSYGDHMGSGQVMALRLRNGMQTDLQRFIEAGNLVLGVCNGFQVMVKLGLLPALQGDYSARRLALMQNDCGHFQNRWVDLRCEPDSPCVFTRGLDRITLPVRHGEGKVYCRDVGILRATEAAGGVACRYVDPDRGEPTQRFPYNPNGSLRAIAGLCDPTGRVFGLMPHPEAYLLPENHPNWDLHRLRGDLPEEGQGQRLFRNAMAYLAGS